MAKLITVVGPPSSGKTSVIIKIIEALAAEGLKVGVIKFDCLSTQDKILFQEKRIIVKVGISGNMCPDHYFVSNILDCLHWAQGSGLDMLISESAGLCNRCSPHIKGVLAVCVIDNLSGVYTPQKIGPMLKLADLIIVTKGDFVSQAEREVFTFRIRRSNLGAMIVHVNGITGQGAYEVGQLFKQAEDITQLEIGKLRFSVPAATCSYCLGQTRIGDHFQMGNVRKMNLTE